jgi:preprotein translocase subunit SecA
MALIDKFLTKIFGNKYDKDIKEISPYVDKVKEVYPEIEKLSNDELRERSEKLKLHLKEAVKPYEEKVKELKDKIENDEVPIHQRDKIYKEIDKIEKDILEVLEKEMLNILPEAFAIVKSTAQRFKDNETIEVTATPFDRDLAATKDFVEIDGDKAIYHNSWKAGGNTVTWDMVHYDVQLIGGVV